MNHDQPSGPLTPVQAANTIIAAADFAENLPVEQRNAFLRNVTTAVVFSLIGTVQGAS